MTKGFIEPSHSPPHLFMSNAVYVVTGATYNTKPFINSAEKKEHVLGVLIERLELEGWNLEARAILHNHYHFIAQSPENPISMSSLIRAFHSITGKYINGLDKTPGRRVLYNYWDTCITHEGSCLARLHYVHVNPVKHGLMDQPEDYPFCSYQWFVRNSNINHRNDVFQQPIDLVNVQDDY